MHRHRIYYKYFVLRQNSSIPALDALEGGRALLFRSRSGALHCVYSSMFSFSLQADIERRFLVEKFIEHELNLLVFSAAVEAD